MKLKIRFVFCLLALVLAVSSLAAQTRLTTPKEHFGFNIGDDYQLASYTQAVSFFQKLAQQSDRLKLVNIGKTAEGRTMWMAILTSPENQKNLARYKEIAGRLALADGLTDEQAQALAREGKAVVWIDGGLHATECLGAQQLIELVWQMVSMNDPETLRLLKDDILLATLVNPDGMELVSNWYMRNPEPTARSTGGLPVLYHKYVGHDDNRDFYMSNMPETTAINNVFYHEWFPLIVYNHHQSGPAGTVLFAPPFRDPFNYYYDPLIPIGIDLVAAAMHDRFIAEGKPGATMRTGASYSTWWNGGLRTGVYFHNMIGLLTEAIGNPTPQSIGFVLQNQLPRGDLPFPIAPQQVWHFRQSIDYSITADRAVMDVASKYREEFLMNIYRMGRNSITKGNQDTWTVHPKTIARIEEAMEADRAAAGQNNTSQAGARGGGRGRGGAASAKYAEMMHDPSLRDPRGFILPSDQPDFLTATKFVNTLIKNGVTIHRATAPFQVSGKNYPAGSYVVKAAQAFRPHIMDMFEPQDHPNDLAYPGGPPKPPYDVAGWTLAYQMGVQFDRILDAFEGPFEKIAGYAKPPAGAVAASQNPAGFMLSHQVNDAFIATNRLFKAGEEVYWLEKPFSANGKSYPAGTLFIPSKPTTVPLLQKMAAEVGVTFDGVATRPAGEALKLRPVRIGLWDQYGGNMNSGWTRWLLEQFEFPFELVFPPALDAGDLNARFDVLIFVGGAIPAPRGNDAGGRGGRGGGGFGGGSQANIPEEYRNRVGSITEATTIPQLRRFLEEGGTILTIGSSTNLAYHLGLPITDGLAVRQADGTTRRLAREEYYIPGSVMQARVDPTNPLAYGLGEQVDFFFDNSPVFSLEPTATGAGLRTVSWFDSRTPLRSGWALGQGFLDQTAAVVEAPVGKGKLFLFGPEILFRGQPHGTFKFLFNGIYYGPAQEVTLK